MMVVELTLSVGARLLLHFNGTQRCKCSNAVEVGPERSAVVALGPTTG
jgi:hypothetical protein